MLKAAGLCTGRKKVERSVGEREASNGGREGGGGGRDGPAQAVQQREDREARARAREAAMQAR
eukprot:3923324-Prymnesium_polylepis.1